MLVALLSDKTSFQLVLAMLTSSLNVIFKNK